MTEVKRYDAVHIRYEDSNIRYGEGCEVEVVAAYDYDALKVECDQLRADLAESEAAWSAEIILNRNLGIELDKIRASEPVFMWHKGATDDESEVVDVDCACPCCVPLYATPQPQPNVAVLVEAMEVIAKTGYGYGGELAETTAKAALAAHRKD